jgi:outer membrane receptor for ferrienterochelin and colicin
MSLRLMLSLCAIAFILPTSSGAQEMGKLTIGVMDFEGVGLPQKQADAIADVIALHISELGDVHVISKADIHSMLNLEKQRRLAGCSDKECFSEIGGALGMQWMVTGNLGIFGDTILLNLKLIDTRSAYVAGRVTRKVRGDMEDLLEELPGAIQELFERVSDRLDLVVEKRVTVAARHPQKIAESPSAVTVVTREQIENTHCTDVICLLRSVPEVDVQRVLPMYAAVGMRALSGEMGDKVLVLVDGREENNDAFGMPYWQNFPVHLEEIERIEVIRGPGSALYGANAYSGVISITTRQAGANAAEAYLGSGELDRSSWFLRVGQAYDQWSFQASGSLETQGHWRIRDKREREVIRARLRVDRETENSTSRLQLGVVAPRGLFFTSLAPAESTDTFVGHLTLSHQVDFFKAGVWVGIWDIVVDPDMPMYFGEIELGRFTSNVEIFNSSLDAEAQVQLVPFEGNLLIAGGNYRWIALFSDQLTPGQVHQHRLGFFVHDEQVLGDSIVITGGVRIDYNNITPWAINPRLAGTWRFAGDQWLRLAFGRAFRKPTFSNTSIHFNNVKGEPGFEELEQFFLRGVGNERLRNESITTFEIGYRGQFLDKELTVEADAFFNLYRDTIAFQIEMATNNLGMPDLARSSIQYDNAGREVNSAGGSVALAFRLAGDWRLGANYTYRYSWFISDTSGKAALEGATGERVKWERAHLANLSVSYIPQEGPRMGISAHASSACDLAVPENGMIFNDYFLSHSPARLLVGGFLAWRVSLNTAWAEIGVKIFNALHQGTRDTPAVARPDGVELGGELLGRRIFVFVRGSI